MNQCVCGGRKNAAPGRCITDQLRLQNWSRVQKMYAEQVAPFKIDRWLPTVLF